MSNAALANAALVLSSKNWKNYSRWGAALKNKSKKPWASISLCRRAGIHAALVKADFFFGGAPTIENKIEQTFQNTKVASTKVAFDTVCTNPSTDHSQGRKGQHKHKLFGPDFARMALLGEDVHDFWRGRP